MGVSILRPYQEVSHVSNFDIHLTTILNMQNKVKNGKRHFVACSGWTALVHEGHLSWSIPDRVLEEDIALLLEGKKLPGFDKPLKCSQIVPAHVGGRVMSLESYI